MHKGRLSAGPLGPVAQYDCQRLAAVQLSLRSDYLHCSLSRQLLAAAALKLCTFGVVTLGILSWGSSRRWGGGAALLIRFILLCSAIHQAADGSELGVAMPNFFTQAATVVAGWLLTGIGDLGVCLPGIFTQPRPGPSMFSWRALAVALDAPQMFSNFTCV